MHKDRWEELKQKMREQKMVVDEELVHEDDKTIETMVLQTPLGKLQLQFIEKPRFLGTKTHYSNRIGSTISIEPEYSDTETVTIFEVSKWNDAGARWERIDPNSLGL